MANRKLQTEIERTLKKVTEGLEIFHETLEKLDSASTAPQKEKVEVELKKEIKKLQRLRDLIKGWQALSELKDKQAINEARRSIELEMERFKVLEKEMKIKAYSKEGLSQAAKLDPHEHEKLKVAQWINQAVLRLNTQTDAFEAELEGLQMQARKTKRLDAERQTRLDAIPAMIERHKLHVKRLEQLLRFMENDRVSPDDVNAIKDDVEYYVEANQDADFVPDEQLYDDFDLVDEDSDSDDREHSSDVDSEEETGSPAAVGVTITGSASGPASGPASGSASGSFVGSVPGSSGSVSSLSPPTPVPDLSSTATPGLVRKTSTSLTEMVPAKPTATPGTAAVIATAPVVSVSAKKVPFVAVATEKKPAPSAPLVFSPPQASSHLPSPTTIVPKVTGPSFASAIAGAVSSAPSVHASLPSAPSNFSREAPVTIKLRPSATAASTIIPTSTHANAPPRPLPMTGMSKMRSEAPPNAYEELHMVVQRRMQEGALKQRTSAALMALLESSFVHCPDGFEMEQSRTFTPKQPFSVPGYYPTQPPAILENPSIFERFELDTLFFIFYYQQKSYAQYLAARELKRQSWRFHKKYLTWFQRHEEPKTITDEFEQGTYIYFDYEGNWCQRKKSEFTFEYRYLEDEETV